MSVSQGGGSKGQVRGWGREMNIREEFVEYRYLKEPNYFQRSRKKINYICIMIWRRIIDIYELHVCVMSGNRDGTKLNVGRVL